MFADKEQFKSEFQKKLLVLYGTTVEEASSYDVYNTLGVMFREHISEKWAQTNTYYKNNKVKQVYYFSLEFLLGRLMGSNLLNLGIYQICREGFQELGIDLQAIEEQEPDAGLGNGGLGRLAACFLDSLASLQLPGHGCGIRYKYGLFEQKIVNGYQVELPDNWLKEGNVWEIRRIDKAVEIRFGGHVTNHYHDGRLRFQHENYEAVLAVPYDMPIVGHNSEVINTLRLWSAETILDSIDAYALSTYDHRKIIEHKRATEAITEFLYPDDSHIEGRTLRLKQQYFFVSAGIQSILRTFKKQQLPWHELPDHVAIHVNDTHPVLAIPELMRILLDEEALGWEEAWDITQRTISYTNHTTLSEALETWPTDMVRSLLPRIYMIIEEIDRRFHWQIDSLHGAQQMMRNKLEIIHYGNIRMANLAVLGSHSVNGVAQVHSDILKHREMNHFYQLFPERFNNKTNGITHRRWLMKANPQLALAITDAIGMEWMQDTTLLKQLQSFSDDRSFQDKISGIKRQNKEYLARMIYEDYGIPVNVDSIFDVHIKRLHAYKRQVLNVFHIMDLYDRLKQNPDLDIPARTFIFGAKAAPSYHFAKKVIKLINTVAKVINSDKTIGDKIKVVFLENYRVSSAEIIIPAADVSEQISTASKEASGTGNMKFMMNGAITIGTLDGANIEIEEAVGNDNIFIFGLTPNEVMHYYQHGGYSSQDIYNAHHRVRKVMDQLIHGIFAQLAPEIRDVYNSLLYDNDEYFVLKDFVPYVDTQDQVGRAYADKNRWIRMAIHNIACSGKFSSDRTIREYASDIWNISPVSK